MTIKELTDSLSKFSGNINAVVYWEDGDKQYFFGIDNLSLTQGTPLRDENGKVGFRFDKDGPASWVFINVSPEQ